MPLSPRSMTQLTLRSAAAALCLLAPIAAAATQQDDARPVAGDPVFLALDVEGKQVSGRISSIGADGLTIRDAANASRVLPYRSLVRVTRQERPMPRNPGGSHSVLLADGDRILQATVSETTDSAIDVQSHSSLGKLKVPLDHVLAVILSAPSEPDSLDELRDKVRNEPRKGDLVWLANGDRAAGSFLGLDDRSVKFQVEGKPAEFDRTGVVALGFDPAVVNAPRPPGDFLELTFADGSRLGVAGAELAKGDVVARTRFGQAIRVPIGELVRIDPRTEVVVPLGERKPDGQSYVAYVGPTLPYRVDLTADGHRLRLGGQTYERGIGTQSRTLLAYKLRPGDRRFQATVGVDDRAGPLGSVVFRVMVDGQERFATPSLGSKDTPRAIDLDISKAKVLILMSEFGDRGDVRDIADWVEARLIR